MKPEPMVGDMVMLSDASGHDVVQVDRRLGRYFFVNGHKFHCADDRTSDTSWSLPEENIEVSLMK